MVLRIVIVFLPLIILASCGEGKVTKNSSENRKISKGEMLFIDHCASCHGEDGKLCASGAKDLTISTLSEKGVMTLLREGKNAMPPMEQILKSNENMEAVIEHVFTLRKK
jgi:mono/diheme cytochrome c family protein